MWCDSIKNTVKPKFNFFVQGIPKQGGEGEDKNFSPT